LIDRFERIARKTGLTFLSETFDTPDLDYHLAIWRGLKNGGLVEITEITMENDAPLEVTVKSLVPGMKPSFTIDGSEPRTIYPPPEEDSFTVVINSDCILKVALYLPVSPFFRTVLEKNYRINKELTYEK